jgi:PAS domain-containing protein
MTMTSERGDESQTQVRRLRQALDLFAQWSDCLQRARDPDALVSGLCRALSASGNYAHVDVVLGQPDAWQETHAWTFVPESISLPLRHQGRRLGALTIAPVQGHDLPDEELDVLVALADDLAFGIDSLAAEKERATAQASLDILSRAIEQSPFAVVITDADGRIEYANPSLTLLTGYQPEEVIGQLPSIWKSDDTPAETYRELWESVREGRRWQGEMRAVHGFPTVDMRADDDADGMLL